MHAFTALSALFALATSANASWSLALYDNSASSDPSNYYSLEGDATSESAAGCITLPNTVPSDVTFCKFFTDGGFSSAACSAGSFSAPSSATLQGGQCAVYHGTGCSGAVSSWGSGSRTNVNNPSSNWNSMKCWST